MKKTYKMEGDCANRMESAARKIDGRRAQW